MLNWTFERRQNALNCEICLRHLDVTNEES